MNRLILLVESRIRGDVYVRFGGELPKTHRRNTAGRWMLSLPLKSVHNLIKDARKVKETVEMVSQISQIYSTNFNKMLSDKNFSVNELAAISDGYAILLKESGNLLTDIKNIVTPSNGLSLSDAERMDIIDKIHSKMASHRNLVTYYSNKNIAISFIRSKEQGDVARVKALYGSPSERYW